MTQTTFTGGCLCGALRYEARGEPAYAGYCCCNDCRRASGSGYVGFMGFAASALTVTGEALTHSLKLADGRVADRNRCALCGSLVYGGILGRTDSHTIYAGSLDDPGAVQADHGDLPAREGALGRGAGGADRVRRDAGRMTPMR